MREADDTRGRLLRAAAEVFAEHGYEDATIRETWLWCIITSGIS
jgi:AcrR family transcriptional regulator